MVSQGSPTLPCTSSLMALIRVRRSSERAPGPGLSLREYLSHSPFIDSSPLVPCTMRRPSFLHSHTFPPAGVATPLTPPVVYGVVDLYGMAVKVTIVHNNNHSDRLRRNNAILRALSPEGALRRAAPTTQAEPERLLFHPNCGQKAAITHEGRTALRPQYGPWGGKKLAEGL